MNNIVIPRRVFEKNRMKLCTSLKKNSLVVVHSNDEMPRNGDQIFPYRQNSDLLYLTGIEQPKTIVVLYPDNPVVKNREILFIEKPDLKKETWFGKRLTREEATEISGIQTIMWLEDFDQALNEMMYYANSIYLNQYLNPKRINELENRNMRFIHTIKHLYPLHQIENIAPVIYELRMIKEPEEIKIINHACSITAQAFDRVLKFVKPGVFEYEVDAEISHEFRCSGAQGHAYPPIVASGNNACILHYEKNKSECKDGELLLLDFGAEFSNYASDCTRTIPINGCFTQRQKKLYNATLSVLKKTKALMVKGSSLNLLSRQVAGLWEEEHVKLGLYSMEDLRRQTPENPLYIKYFMHGISHFMGLDVHDVGTRFHTFEPGMILTCEPGIYIPEEGIGIRLENDILITEGEPIDLMQHIPVEAEEIEARMRK